MAKYSFGKAILDCAAVVAAPATGGLSLIFSPTARNLVMGALGSGDDNSSLDRNMEQWKIQNEQWKIQNETQRAKLERLRKERQEEENKVKKNNDEIERIRAIINDPNKSDEEKTRAKKRSVILEDENRNFRKKIGDLEGKIKTNEVSIPAPSAPLGLSMPRFDFTTKLMIIAVSLVIIYFLFLRK